MAYDVLMCHSETTHSVTHSPDFYCYNIVVVTLFLLITLCLVGIWSIVLSMSLYLSTCISQKPYVLILPNFFVHVNCGTGSRLDFLAPIRVTVEHVTHLWFCGWHQVCSQWAIGTWLMGHVLRVTHQGAELEQSVMSMTALFDSCFLSKHLSGEWMMDDWSEWVCSFLS